MAEVWPFDEKMRLESAPSEAIRPFRCLLLMPFAARFSQIAEILKDTVHEIVTQFTVLFGPDLPHIKRVDWITSSGAIQEDIWTEIALADLVFCDITGYNENVMFEAGVCAAWKRLPNIVFLKDVFFKQPSAFDIAPIRYTEYELTTDGVGRFRQQIAKLVRDALIAFPDLQGMPISIDLPLTVDFGAGRDDERIYTPPFAHRRVVDGRLEFGSITHFSHSWASIGKRQFLTFDLSFSAKFANRVAGHGYIGVGFRSQHYYANFAHIVYLNHEGRIMLVQPDDSAELHYRDIELRGLTDIDFDDEHRFRVAFDESALRIEVDDISVDRPVAEMPKVFGPGLIRFQSHLSWMAISRIGLQWRG